MEIVDLILQALPNQQEATRFRIIIPVTTTALEVIDPNMQMRVSRNVTLTPKSSKYTLFCLPVTEINIDVGVYLYMKRFAHLSS